MSWLNNLKIVVKVGLIVALLGIVMIGETLFAASRMRAMDDANTDLVTRVDKYTTLATRASRFAEAYISGAFQLAVETTDEGNAKYLAQTKDSKKTYQTRMAEVVKHLPEEASAINPVLAGFEKAFAVCDPAIEYAATTSTPEENMKAAARLKAECVPLVEAALGAQTKLVDDLLAHSHKRSDAMTAEAELVDQDGDDFGRCRPSAQPRRRHVDRHQGDVAADRSIEGRHGDPCSQRFLGRRSRQATPRRNRRDGPQRGSVQGERA